MPMKGVGVRALADPARSAQKLRDAIKKVDGIGLENASENDLLATVSLALALINPVVLALVKQCGATAEPIVLSHSHEHIKLPDQLMSYVRQLAYKPT